MNTSNNLQIPRIFLPGWGFKGSIWQKTVDLMNYPSLLLDLPGNKEANLDQITMTLSNKIPHGAVLIAWSLSGLFAIDLCYKFPEKIKKLILVSSSPYFLNDGAWKGISMADRINFMALASENMPALQDKFTKLVAFPSRDKGIPLELKQHLYDNNFLLLHHLLFLFSLDLREKFSALNLPILYIHGGKDVIIQENKTNIGMLNQKINYEILPAAGHVPFLTHTPYFISLLQDFIKD